MPFFLATNIPSTTGFIFWMLLRPDPAFDGTLTMTGASFTGFIQRHSVRISLGPANQSQNPNTQNSFPSIPHFSDFPGHGAGPEKRPRGCPPNPLLGTNTARTLRWGSKIKRACRSGAPDRCLRPSFPANTFEGTTAFRNEGTMRGAPLEKVVPDMKMGEGRGQGISKKKEEEMSYRRMGAGRSGTIENP